MKICFVIDARSPHARNWIRYFVQMNHEVHVISSYPISPESLEGTSLYMVPLTFFDLVRFNKGTKSASEPQGNSLTAAYLQNSWISKLIYNNALFIAAMFFRYWITSIEIFRYTNTICKLIEEIQPDIIHAMRIPFEGILAAKATPSGLPVLISVWGNDFTLFAKRYPLIGWQTKQTMQRADALHCDCQRDLRLAKIWGFKPDKPAIVLPSAGGIQTSIFYPGPISGTLREELRIPDDASVVINPRGFRGYVRNDIFFRAIRLVLEQRPNVVFLCSAMEGNPMAERWVRSLNISHAVRLLPIVPRDHMADFFRLAQVTVSPSVHDGTPNTLLEAMACGCFPVAGDIESIREWITDGVNGLLCDPTDPQSLARAILRALDDTDLRYRAREHNLKLIAERAEYGKVMAQAEQFYYQIVEYALSKRKRN